MNRSSLPTVLIAIAFFLALTGPGQAVVIWTSNVDIPIPTTFDGVYLDLDTGGRGGPVDWDTLSFRGADANFFFGGFAIGNDADFGLGAPTWQPVRLAADNTSAIANHAKGDLIGIASPFGNGYGGSSNHLGAEFQPGVPGYIGFSIDSTGDTLYGWMLVTLNVNPNEGVIHSWAIQDNGGAIPAGVPEPTAPLLALLGLGALALRRRR